MKKLLLGILLLPSLVMASGPLQSQRYFKNNGGLFDHVSPLLIPENSATSIENISMDARGQLTKRDGYTVIQSTHALGPSTWTVTGGGYHTSSAGNNFFAVVSGTDVYRIPNSFSSYSKVTGNVSLTLNKSNLAQKTDLQDKTIFCNELDKPFYVDSLNNATHISTITFSAAKTCTTFTNYLIVANTTESIIKYPSRVRWSDVNDINSFPPLNYIDVEPDDGDKIVGIVQYQDAIYIFKHNSIYQMLVTGLDGPDAFIIRPISRKAGAWAKQSIKVIPQVGIFFLGQHTAYILNTSYASQYSENGLTPIGDAIQNTFNTIQRSQWANAIGEVYPKHYQYWLAVSTAGTTNTEVLVYDYIQKNWTVYDNMNISMLSQAEDANGNSILVSGSNSATTYKQDTGFSDNPAGTSLPITASYTTPDLIINTPEITKGFKYLYLYTIGDVNYSLNVKVAYDYTSTYELNTTINVGSAGAVYGTAVYDTDIYPASGIGVNRIELNRSARAIRLQFNNSSSNQIFGLVGWVIVFNLEDYKQ